MELEQKIEKLLGKVGFVKDKDIRHQIISRISREREIKAELSVDKMVSQIKNDHPREAGLDLTLLLRPDLLENLLSVPRTNLENPAHIPDSLFHRNAFLFLTQLTLNLKFFLPHWNLQDEGSYSEGTLSRKQIDHQINENRVLLRKWESGNPAFRRQALSLLD